MTSMKRTLEDGMEGEPKKAKPEVDTADLQEQRVLIDNTAAGVIIGRGGCNVTDLRTKTKCSLSILKSEAQGSKERVLVLKGTVSGNALCLQLISELMLEAINTKNADTDSEVVTEYTFKLLLHKFLAGSIIGKAGTIIKQITEETGVRMRLSNDPLPGSTEKTCTMTGTPDVLYASAQRVLQQLYENPLRGNSSITLYVPGGATAFPMPPGGFPFAAYQQQAAMFAPPQQLPHYPPQQQQQAFGRAPAGLGGLAGVGAIPAGSKTEKIVIPTVCAGTVIGKGGSIIREIKMQSATQISIADPEPGALDDRVVAITGSQQGINTAIFLIKQRVESYQPPSGATAGMY